MRNKVILRKVILRNYKDGGQSRKNSNKEAVYGTVRIVTTIKVFSTLLCIIPFSSKSVRTLLSSILYT